MQAAIVRWIEYQHIHLLVSLEVVNSNLQVNSHQEPPLQSYIQFNTKDVDMIYCMKK